MIVRIKLVISILAFTLIFSCEKEDNEALKDDNKLVLEFSPPNASWFGRQFPDSLIVNIINGVPPYAITTRPIFSCNASIFESQLILYPLPFTVGAFGDDLVVVEDNEGNNNSFKIKVESLDHKHDSIIELSLIVKGDTSFTITENDLRFGSGRWDEYSGDLSFGGQFSTSGGFGISLESIKDTGLARFTTIYDILIIADASLPANQRFQLVLNDTNQQALVKKLSKDEIMIEASVNLIDNSNAFQNIHTASIRCHAISK